jgi:autotransporter-associated beta strand protein
MVRSCGALFFILALAASAADLQWTGGSGTWSTTAAQWFDGASTVAWPTTAASAVFGGAPGTVTVGTPTGRLFVESMTFKTAGYTVAGFLLNSSPNGLTIETQANATIAGTIFAGSAGPGQVLTKTGSGTLFVNSIAFFEQINVLQGEMRATSTGGTDSGLYHFAPGGATRLTLDGYVNDAFGVGGLDGGNASTQVYPLTSSLSGADGPRSLDIGDHSGSFAGIVRDNGANVLSVSKSVGGTQELTAANTWSGPTSITGGTLAFAGNGSALNTPSFTLTLRGGALLLDNTATANSNRIADTAPISLTGAVILKGHDASPVNEIAGDLKATGAGVVQVIPAPGQPAALTFQTFNRTSTTASNTIFLGSHLGEAPAPGVASIRFLTAPALVGGAGLDGTTTVSILPGAFGGESSASSLVTYGANGVRPLTDAEYATDPLTAPAAANLHLAGATTLSAPVTANAVRLAADADIQGSSTLTVTSGAVLALPGTTRLATGTLNFGAADGLIYNDGDLEISSSIIGSKGLRKSGSGTLTVSGGNLFSGTTVISAGNVRLASNTALGATTAGTTAATGVTLDLLPGVTIGAEALSINGSTVRSRSGSTAWGGAISGYGTLAVEAGTLTLGGNVSGTMSKTGAGTLLFTGDSSYLSRFTVSQGTVRATQNANRTDVFGSHGPLGSDPYLRSSRLELAPSGSGADVVLTIGATNSSLTYTGPSVLSLDRGQNASLTLTTYFTRSGTGILYLSPASGDLGGVEKVKLSSGASTTNGLITPWIVLQSPDAQQSAFFLGYNSTNGLVRAASAPAGIPLQSASATSLFVADTPQTLTANAAVYALINQGQTIDLGASTLNLGSSSPSPSAPVGIILNGGQINGGTLALQRNEEMIYTSLAGATISSSIASSYIGPNNALTLYGPGTLTLSGNNSISGITRVGSGTLRLDGRLTGTLRVDGGATFTGSGALTGSVAGGLISPGNGRGTLTATSTSRSQGVANFVTQVEPTSFAFEFAHAGLTGIIPGDNDLLRLTSTTAPIGTALASDNTVSLYFQTPGGLHLGDTFLGGFYSDLAADFSASIQDANFKFYLSDATGDVLFEGQRYSEATGLEFAISTVPLTADFGAGAVNGSVMEVTIIPEPASTALILSAFLAAGPVRLRRNRA